MTDRPHPFKPIAAAVPRCLLLGWLAVSDASPAQAEAAPAALFPFELVDTSLQGALGGVGAQQGERARLIKLDAQLSAALAAGGLYAPLDAASRTAATARGRALHDCGGCDVDLAASLGARVSVVGWVQKVSNLILNVNVVIRSVPDGRVLHAGSVDMRGNTEESWTRGLDYLLRERLHLAGDSAR